MPERIRIDGFHIDDADFPDTCKGPAVLGDFNTAYRSAEDKEAFPCAKTREVITENITTESGKPFQRSRNPFIINRPG